MMMMGFPMNVVNINGISDRAKPTCFINLANYNIQMSDGRLTVKLLCQALSQMAGNAMHLRAVGAALCSMFKARLGKWKHNYHENWLPVISGRQCLAPSALAVSQFDTHKSWLPVIVGSQYSGSQYSGSQYSGSQYSGNQYSGSQHSGSQYSGRKYSGRQYSSRQYSGS